MLATLGAPSGQNVGLYDLIDINRLRLSGQGRQCGKGDERKGA